MASFTTNRGRHTVAVCTPDIELVFSLDDGGLRVLRRTGGPSVIGHGEPTPTVDVRLEDVWLSQRSMVRYLGHTVEDRDGGVLLSIACGVGPLIVYDEYRITGTLISRRVRMRNVGEDPVQLRSVRLEVPWARVGSSEACRFDAPGNSVRPRVPLSVAAAQRYDVLPRRFFAPGLRDGRALEPAPISAPGLLALYDIETDETLLCWYYSEIEAAIPQIEGNDAAVTLRHELGVAGWLAASGELSAGTQYILLLREPWPAALDALQRTWSLVGVHGMPNTASWVHDAAIYEAHPSQFGGFAGLADQVPHLRALGINTLCLMPIWDFANRKGELWDGNWDVSGNPYAIRDFELLDPTLGTADDLRNLIATAHQHGVRVLVDLPLVGCAVGSRHVAERPDWFAYDERERLARTDDEAIARFDWDNQSLRHYMQDWALRQIRAFDLDGFRATLPRIPVLNWMRLQAAHASIGSLGFLRLLEQLQPAIKSVKTDAVLLDVLSGPANTGGRDFAIDELSHHMFIHLGLNRVSPTELGEWLEDCQRVMTAGLVRVCFTESHRTRVINPLADGLRGSRISRMLLSAMVLCGFVPQLWFGQEQNEERFITALLQARAQHPVLRYGAIHYNAVPCSNTQIFSVVRTCEHEQVVGLLNVSPHRHTVTLSIPVDVLGLNDSVYELHELISEQVWEEAGRRRWRPADLLSINLTLGPFGYYFFALRPAPIMVVPAPKVLNGIEATSSVAHGA